VIRDDTISSEHAVIELEGGRYWLEDLRSTNGTKHRDVRLAPGQRVPLKVGDHVRFADLDLMFVAPGHVPGGATVVLPSTSTPPSHWRSADRSTGGPGATGPAPAKPALRDAARPLFDASTSELFRESLDYHLDRVTELSPAFARFVARAFEEEMRAALCVAAAELVQTAQREDRITERRYTQDRIRYVVCGAPGGMGRRCEGPSRRPWRLLALPDRADRRRVVPRRSLRDPRRPELRALRGRALGDALDRSRRRP
jgi:pSer/pThr/pTyr-binding forkhead associated (FHA) protein